VTVPALSLAPSTSVISGESAGTAEGPRRRIKRPDLGPPIAPGPGGAATPSSAASPLLAATSAPPSTAPSATPVPAAVLAPTLPLPAAVVIPSAPIAAASPKVSFPRTEENRGPWGLAPHKPWSRCLCHRGCESFCRSPPHVPASAVARCLDAEKPLRLHVYALCTPLVHHRCVTRSWQRSPRKQSLSLHLHLHQVLHPPHLALPRLSRRQHLLLPLLSP
jgi:hypothetical protein